MTMPPSETPTVVYVADAYCGWCWGFAQRVAEFEAANRDKVLFTAISGGLFVGGRAGALSDYPHIPDANARIARITGAVFGHPYQALLAEGTMVMNSEDAGAALAALRRQAPERAIHWVHELQDAFYGKGLSLSDRATIADIARRNGLDAGRVEAALLDGTAMAEARGDFALARELGATSYPTLLFLHAGQVHRLPGTGTALHVMNAELAVLLKASS